MKEPREVKRKGNENELKRDCIGELRRRMNREIDSRGGAVERLER